MTRTAIDPEFVAEQNALLLANLKEDYTHLAGQLARRGVDIEKITARVASLRVAIPSWGVGTGGTRFARFPGAAALSPRARPVLGQLARDRAGAARRLAPVSRAQALRARALFDRRQRVGRELLVREPARPARPVPRGPRAPRAEPEHRDGCC